MLSFPRFLEVRSGVGIALGLLAAVVFGVLSGERTTSSDSIMIPQHGPVLSDCDGAIEELVIQYVPEASGIVETAYRQFLSKLPGDITVNVICPNQPSFKDFQQRIGSTSCRIEPLLTGHPMTCWSRDRWLAFGPVKPGSQTVLLSPAEETGEGLWPQRKGDRFIANDLAVALSKRVMAHRSTLFFDGGDFVADAESVFVTPNVLRRNLGKGTYSNEELAERLKKLFHKRIVLLSQGPNHHAGMFLMLSGEKTAVVGDPSLASDMMQNRNMSLPDAFPLADPDYSFKTCRLFDAVAERCAEEGYRVVRIPIVPGRDGRTYLTYLNVILDYRCGEHIVYMPVFRGADALNNAAEIVWKELGYKVERIDCTNTFRHFGSLRCLVNVLRRGTPGDDS